MSEISPDYKPARILTVALQIVLVFQIGAAAGCAVATFASTSQTITLPPGIFEAYELMRRSLQFSSWVVIVVLMFWVYRVSQNAHEIADPEPTVSPGWAVGWFFVPVANLVRPYLVLSELYNASRRPDAWKELGRPLVTGVWGILNVLAVLLFVTIRISRINSGIPPAGLVAAGLAVVALQQVAMLIICSRIAVWQNRISSSEGVESVF